MGRRTTPDTAARERNGASGAVTLLSGALAAALPTALPAEPVQSTPPAKVRPTHPVPQPTPTSAPPPRRIILRPDEPPPATVREAPSERPSDCKGSPRPAGLPSAG